jgi:HAE1 family hydrophobic/amphiphilic exporter-1
MNDKTNNGFRKNMNEKFQKNLFEEKAEAGGKESYFSRLKFNPKDFGIFSWGYFNNVRIVILFVLVLAVGGASSFVSIPRNLSPEVEIPIVFISTILPGASSEDVESLITIPIEDKVMGIEKIDTLFSTSTEGRSGVTVQFQSGANIRDAENDVQNAVSSISGLPENATDPMVASLDLENQPIWTFSLVSNIDEASLDRFSQELKKEIENLSKVDRVENRGMENQEIQIMIKPEVFKSVGANALLLSQAIGNAVSSYPVGIVDSSQASFSISLDPTVSSIKDLRDLNINVNGTRYILSEIATISERPSPGQAGAYLLEKDSDPRKAITFDVYRNLSERIDLSYEEVESLVSKKIKEQDGKFEIRTIYSTAEEIEKQFNDLFKNFSVTMILVFVVLFLFFGIRQALIASIAIPFSFLFSFIAMQAYSISLNFLSMFSLLISLGLLVDVTIVIVSAITSYYKTGKFTPIEAGLLVWRDFRITLLVTTMTTVWAFSPLLLASGIIGEFIRPIPIVVSATLIGSFIVGIFITLPLMIVSLRPQVPRRVKILIAIALSILLVGSVVFIFRKNALVIPVTAISFLLFAVAYNVRKEFEKKINDLCRKDCLKDISDAVFRTSKNGLVSLSAVGEYYRKIIEKIIISKTARRKTLASVIIFSVFSFALVPAGFVVNEFFPKSDMDFFYVGVELPLSTNLEISKEEALDLARDLKNIPELEALQIQLGAKIRPEGDIASAPGFDSILFTLTFVAEEDRERSSIEIAEEIRKKFKDYDKGKVSVVELSGGPPAGADINIKFLGPDLDRLNEFADEAVKYLESQPGVANIGKSVNPGAAKIVFYPNEEKFSEIGLSNSELGSSLRLFANGLEMDSDVKLSDLSEDRDIILRLSENVQDVSSLGIASEGRTNLSIFSLGDFRLKTNPNEISREDGERSLSVSASVREGYSPSIMNKALENFADSMDLPGDYGWKTGGANEENQKSVQSIFKAMLLAFVLILATLVIQLGSYRKALIVMLVIPLALSGVFVIFAITGTPLSFPALVGVLALFGIVVNNSIILVDKINLNLRSKMDLSNSIADASSSRLEPIALGSLTTIIGLIPITLSDPLWQGLGGAIIAGLIFSGTIMLFFIPVVYYSWFKEEKD